MAAKKGADNEAGEESHWEKLRHPEQFPEKAKRKKSKIKAKRPKIAKNKILGKTFIRGKIICKRGIKLILRKGGLFVKPFFLVNARAPRQSKN